MGDFFSRKGLLSDGQRSKIAPLPVSTPEKNAPPPGVQHNAIAPPAPAPAAAESEGEVFERVTVVPSLPAEAHAKALMDALDGGHPAPATQSPHGVVTLSFSSMELALDENPTTLGFIEAQKERVVEPELELLDPKPNLQRERLEPHGRGDLEELYQLGDFSAALELAEARLRADPHDGVALNYKNRCHDRLVLMLMARVGRLDAKVEMLVAPDQLRWLSVDHRAGFVLSLIDGTATVEEVLDVAAMPRLEALRILVDLKERGVIGVVR